MGIHQSMLNGDEVGVGGISFTKQEIQILYNNFRDLDMTEVTFLCAFCACQISLETIKLLFKLTLTEAEQEKRNENRTLLTKLKSIFQYRF